MRITLFRNNSHAPNGLMSQEEVECDVLHFITDDVVSVDSESRGTKRGRILFVNRADFAAILVDTRAQQA